MPLDLAAQLLIKEPAALSETAENSPFVKLYVRWFTTDPRPYPFVGNRGKLLFLILHLSRLGKQPLALTTEVTKQLGMSRKERWKHLERLEADGWVQVERHSNKAVVVHPILKPRPVGVPNLGDAASPI